MMEMVYLDNNATTKPASEVVAAMLPYLTQYYGNPSSVHRLGQQSRQGIAEARSRVASLIRCRDSELTFTGGGTEAVNTVVRGLLAARAPRRRIVTSTVEHSATRELCTQLQREGTQIVAVPVNQQGEIDLDRLRCEVNDETALVTLLWANNETGVIFPVEAIARICTDRKVPFHCDGTQAVGKIPADVKVLGLDAMSFAAHKFHGPKGVGCFHLRRGVKIRSLVVGGPQEGGRRGGTENVPGIVGAGVAAELALQSLPMMADVARLRDRLEAGIVATIEGAVVNGSTRRRLPNTTNISFPRLEAEAILLLLSERGIAASAGAACSSGSLEPSPVILAMGIDPKLAHGAIRFSLSRFTTEPEIDTTLAVLPEVIRRLRDVVPV